MTFKDRELDVRQAALWLGCTPSFVLGIMKTGWLKPIKRYEQKVHCRFYHWQLEVVTWDIAHSLSMYDIVAIRRNSSPSEPVARQRGIPIRVVDLIRTADVFDWIVKLHARYANRRTRNRIKLADVTLPEPNSTLAQLLPALSSQERIVFYPDSANPAGTLVGKGSSSRAGLGRRNERQVFGRTPSRWKWNQWRVLTPG